MSKTVVGIEGLLGTETLDQEAEVERPSSLEAAAGRRHNSEFKILLRF